MPLSHKPAEIQIHDFELKSLRLRVWGLGGLGFRVLAELTIFVRVALNLEILRLNWSWVPILAALYTTRPPRPPTQSYKRQGAVTPSLLELLSWHCLHIHGLCPGSRPPCASPAVIQMLKDNMDRKVSVALIPLGSSIPESRQQHYDWLSRAREAYSLGLWELAQQTILSLESGVSGPLYDSKDKLHFRAQVAEEAIGALTVRALKTMLTANPDAFPVLAVASWNTKPAQVHREMLATRELCLANTVGDMLSAPHLSQRFFLDTPWLDRSIHRSPYLREDIGGIVNRG